MADQISLNDGRVYSGAIINADESFINIQIDDSTTAKIPHGLVQSVFFRYADVVYLLSGEEIKCKILNERFPNLHIINDKGMKLIKLVDLKRYFYNDTDSLTLNSLPQTGTQFNNEKSLQLIEKTFSQSIFLSISGGFAFVQGKKWQDNFLTSSSLLGVLIQAQAGLSPIKNVSAHLGFTYGLIDNTITSPDNQVALDGKISSNYYYIGFDYFPTFKNFLPQVKFSIGTDIGLYKLNGSIYSYSYREIDLSDLSAKIAYRPRVSARTFVSDRIAVYLNAGYFLVQDFSATVPADLQYEIKIPLSGWTLYVGANYHFPIKLW
jgi:hypothetical protein